MARICIILYLLLPFGLLAQNGGGACKNNDTVAGSISYVADADLIKMEEFQLQKNRTAAGIDGYRIQIFFGKSRTDAKEAQDLFLEEFPHIRSYLLFQNPYFKVRVGNFRNRLETQSLYYTLKEKFPSVIVVYEKNAIDFPDLDQHLKEQPENEENED